MPIMRNVHLISVQSWTYLSQSVGQLVNTDLFCVSPTWIHLSYLSCSSHNE